MPVWGSRSKVPATPEKVPVATPSAPRPPADVATKCAHLLTQIKKNLARYPAEELEDGLKQLADVNKLIQKVRFNDDLQTPTVGRALLKVEDVLARLGQASAGGSVDDIYDVVVELVQAAKNLRNGLPGDVHLADGNKATGRGSQLNGAIIFAGSQRPDRLVSEAMRNEVADGFQTNAPIYGIDSSGFMAMMSKVDPAKGTA